MAHNFIITSDDRLAAFKKVDELSMKFDSSYERASIDLMDEGLYQLVDELNTVSLFNDPKLIVVKSSELLFNNKNEKAFNELIKAMNNVENENVLIFVFLDKIDFNNEKYQKIKKVSSYVDIKIKNIPLNEYAQKSFEDEGYTITPQGLSLLQTYVDSLETMENAIEILKCFKASEKKIDDKDVVKMINAPLEDNVFDLVDAVIYDNKKQIMKCYNDLKIKNIQATYIISLLVKRFQEIYNVSVLVKANVSQDTIASLFGVSSGRAYYMIKNAKQTTLDIVKKKLQLLNELEYNIKTGKLEQNIGLELFFLK
ncbi:MAG: DNA polymerase III subunit delta [Acholeplasmatales bacterium]|nr:DNA polymerase III subunit delta [Acholeplasmatales bacterium]